VGGASVSSLHANWIVNEEKRATAADVRELVSRCQEKVLQEQKIMLQPELVIW
jgi:UDP-N-acetylenolpyruvoylglucosamine reductase